jgi:hypothetical protein
MVGDWDFEFDIREACPNRVKYLREAVEVVAQNYSDIDVVDGGTELGPCFYRTVFRVSVSNLEDHKAVTLAVARINQLIRDIKERQASYGWAVFEKEAYIDGGYVYMWVTWVKKVRIPGRRYTSVMELYELALPHMGAKPTVELVGTAIEAH